MKSKAITRGNFLKKRKELLKKWGKERFEISDEKYDEPLSYKQQQIILGIKKVISGLNKYKKYSGKEIEQNESLLDAFNQETNELNGWMLKAYHAGLKDYPLVKHWHNDMYLLEQRNVLKKAKNYGAERGTRSPLKINRNLREEIIKRNEEGKNWKTINKELVNEKFERPLYPRMRTFICFSN